MEGVLRRFRFPYLRKFADPSARVKWNCLKARLHEAQPACFHRMALGNFPERKRWAGLLWRKATLEEPDSPNPAGAWRDGPSTAPAGTWVRAGKSRSWHR